MRQVSIIIGKLAMLALKLVGRSGSALPGLIVEKLDRSFLKKTLGELEQGFIVVTGTNGKTTTTKIISDLLQAAGLKVLTNKTGSNFVRGVISTIVEAAAWSGELTYDVAVFEQDEAHAVHMVKKARPRGVVALNVMRDQLDRFGEIDITARHIQKVAASASEFVVLNANDPRIGKFAEAGEDKQFIWFGHSKNLTQDFLSDDQHHSGARAEFFEASTPDVCLVDHKPGTIKLKAGGKTYTARMKLDGPHNALNAAAAVAAVSQLRPKASIKSILSELGNIEPAFGRGETIELNSGAKLRLQLIKNPAGFTHSLKLLKPGAFASIGIMINDDHADGRDVSWLWDVAYDKLADITAPITCGGKRGWDMALRLKYDNIKANKTQTNLEKFTREIVFHIEKDKIGVVFCTYTAMLELRGELAKYSREVKGSIL